MPSVISVHSGRVFDKRRDLHANSLGVGVDVGLDALDPQRLDPAIGGDPLEDGVYQRFLEVVAPFPGDS